MPKRILITDDSAPMLKALRIMIEQIPGWIVAGEASNGRQAIQQVALLKPDLVILDLSMPVMNGLDALEDQMCDYVPPVSKSPDRMDALVWALTELTDDADQEGIIEYSEIHRISPELDAFD